MGETLTIPFDSLPLGFRFHPKDDELINHYLKRKIDGRIKPCDAAVIPEIDVCKFEPWDLPERSPIRSLDQEWFFFAPVDRKYPSGNRWNRATEAGYWKATGKDRLIRSRGAGGATMLVGMKKTLVFHQGRAPKGVRTNWIMHEYRTVEPEFDCSGDQGGFVLCRLFRKSEETLPCSSSNVMERSGLSPTPNSSPNSILNEGEGLEESATPLDRSPDIDLLEELQPLPDNTIEQSVEKTAVNEAENLIPHPLKLEESHFHRNLTSDACDYEGEILREEGPPLFDYLAPFLGPEYAHLFSDELPQKSLMQSSVDYPTHGDMKSKMHEQDSVTELLDAIVCTPEEYSAEASNSQADSASKLMPDNQTSMINHDPLLIAHGGITHLQASEQSCRLPFPSNALQIDPSDIYNETNPMRYALAENSDPSLLCPHPSMESPVDLFINNSQSRMLESNINIRYRPPLNSESSVNSEQGLAERRIRLQILKHVEGEGRVVTRNDKKGSTSKATEEDDKPFKNETAFVGDHHSSSVDDTLMSLRLTKQTNDAGSKLEGSSFSQVICRVGSVSLRQMSVVMLVNVFMFCVGTWFFNSYRG